MNTSSLSSVLMLSSAEVPTSVASTNAFVNAVNQGLGQSCKLERVSYAQVGVTIINGVLDAFLISDKRSLTTFQAVYIKSYQQHQDQAAAIAQVLDAHAVRYVGRELRRHIPAEKLSQMALLARANVPVPDTLYLPMRHYASHFEYIKSLLGIPFIFKATDAMSGNDNYLVQDDAESFAKLTIDNANRNFIAQRFIPNVSDMRVLIIEDNIRLVIERQRASKATHLNNTSKGAGSRLIPLKELAPELQTLALRAAHAMGRDVSGVDLMLESHTQKPYVLEVNASPQITAGAFKDQKVAVFEDYFTELATKP